MVIHHTQRKLQKSGASAGQDAEIYVEKRRIVPGRGGREREREVVMCVCPGTVQYEEKAWALGAGGRQSGIKVQLF